jgi:hypothetical protein
MTPNSKRPLIRSCNRQARRNRLARRTGAHTHTQTHRIIILLSLRTLLSLLRTLLSLSLPADALPEAIAGALFAGSLLLLQLLQRHYKQRRIVIFLIIKI